MCKIKTLFKINNLSRSEVSGFTALFSHAFPEENPSKDFFNTLPIDFCVCIRFSSCVIVVLRRTGLCSSPKVVRKKRQQRVRKGKRAEAAVYVSR